MSETEHLNPDQKKALEDFITKCAQAISDKLDHAEPIHGEAYALVDMIEKNIKYFDAESRTKFEELIPRFKAAADREFRKITL